MSATAREMVAKMDATLNELDRLRSFRNSILADCNVNLDRIHSPNRTHPTPSELEFFLQRWRDSAKATFPEVE